MLLQKTVSISPVAFEIKQSIEYGDMECFNASIAVAQMGDGDYGFLSAVYHNKLDQVIALIPFTSKSVLGGPAINDAASLGRPLILKELIPFADEEILQISLTQAVVCGHVDCLNVLLPHVDCTFNSSYPLQVAANAASVHRDSAIFDLLYGVSNPYEALEQLRARRADQFSVRPAGERILEERIALDLKHAIHAQIGGMTMDKPVDAQLPFKRRKI